MIKRIIIISAVTLILIVTLLCLNRDKKSIVLHEEIINEEIKNEEVIVEEKEIKQEKSSDNNIDYEKKQEIEIIAPNNIDIEEPIKKEQIEINIENIAKEENKPSLAQEYIDYCKLSKQEQYDFYKSFSSSNDFLNWYKIAKAEYEKENPVILLEEGETIDLKD